MEAQYEPGFVIHWARALFTVILRRSSGTARPLTDHLEEILMRPCNSRIVTIKVLVSQRMLGEAVKWFRKIADFSSEAAFYLGVKYSNGEGVTEDKAEALRWYQKAAQLGDETAQFNLGVMYRDGAGVVKDAKEAFHWFQKAAEQGMDDAEVQVGYAYQLGLGVLQDHQQAEEWYFKAARQGQKLAQAKLGVIYMDAADTPTNRIEAHKWFSLAAAQGYETAKSLRDDIALKMSASELAEARKRAQAFLAGDIPAQLVEIQTVAVDRPAVRGQARITPTTMKEGVPLAIYNAITAAAAKEWPGDYQMQAFVIKTQLEAYRKLHPQ